MARSSRDPAGTALAIATGTIILVAVLVVATRGRLGYRPETAAPPTRAAGRAAAATEATPAVNRLYERARTGLQDRVDGYCLFGDVKVGDQPSM